MKEQHYEEVMQQWSSNDPVIVICNVFGVRPQRVLQASYWLAVARYLPVVRGELDEGRLGLPSMGAK